MRASFLTLFVLCLGPVSALATPFEDYQAVTNDESRIVGEGFADSKKHDDNVLLAQKAALKQARESLAQAMRTKVKVQSMDLSENGEGEGTETFEFKVEGYGEAVLADVRTKTLADFPKKGQVTVLAWVSRKEFEKKLARAPRMGGWGYRAWGGLSNVYSGEGNHGGTGPMGGLDISWNNWVLGFSGGSWEYSAGSAGYIRPDGSEGKLGINVPASLLGLSAGYDLAPWRWRFHPYVPLRLRYVIFRSDAGSAAASGVSAGLGFRYFPTNWFCLDLSGNYGNGFGASNLTKDGKTVNTLPNSPATFHLNGYTELALGVNFTAF